jgi:hypothetical protein
MTDLSPAAQAVLDAADIKNNGAVTTPGVNPWNEAQDFTVGCEQIAGAVRWQQVEP